MTSKNLIIFILLFLAAHSQRNTEVPIHERYFGKSLQGKWHTLSEKINPFAMINYNNNKTNSTSLDSKNKAEDEIKFTLSYGVANALISRPLEKSKKANIYLQLVEKEYKTNNIIEFKFEIEKGYNKSVNEWKTPKFMTPVHLYKNMKHIVTFDIEMYYQMKYVPEKKYLNIKILSDSAEIEFELYEKEISLTYNPIVILTAISMTQILLLLYLFYNKNIINIANTSEWLILQSCLYIIIQTIFILKVSIMYIDTKYKYLFINVILNIIVLTLILMKFEPVLYKFTNKIKFLFCILFVVLYFRTIYMYYMQWNIWIVECTLIFLWQIGYSILRGGTGGINIAFIIVIILSKVPLIMFMRESGNILQIENSILASNMIIISIIFNILIMIVQKYKGSRYFIPNVIIPDYFDYLRKTVYKTLVAQETCGICLNEIRAHPMENEEQAKERRQNEINIPGYMDKEIVYVSTPCLHNFHKECLTDWLHTKLVCPADRRDLPPMNLGEK